MLLSLGFSSCVSKKKYIYFQDQIAKDSALLSGEMAEFIQPTIKPNDLLSISVSALDPKVVAPFNLNSGNTGSTNNVASEYLVDQNGMIEFPVIGSLQVGGYNRVEVTNLLKDKLKAYISNPIVNIRLLNFKVVVLGDVRSPGVLNISTERISLPEAISMVGDLKITALRKNVLVIRYINGRRTETRVDLTSKDVFKSPVFYLAQNDIIYVEPNRAALASNSLARTYLAISLTSVSLLVNVINLLTR